MSMENSDAIRQQAKELASKVVLAYDLSQWENEDDDKKVMDTLHRGLEQDKQADNHEFKQAFLEEMGSRLATFLPHLDEAWSKKKKPEEKDSYLEMMQQGTFNTTLSNVDRLLSIIESNSTNSNNFKSVFKTFFKELDTEHFKVFSDKVVQRYSKYLNSPEAQEKSRIINQLVEFYRKENIANNIGDLRQQITNNQQLDPFHLGNKDSQAKIDHKNNPQLNPFKH
jgi:hypothetical protein